MKKKEFNAEIVRSVDTHITGLFTNKRRDRTVQEIVCERERISKNEFIEKVAALRASWLKKILL